MNHDNLKSYPEIKIKFYSICYDESKMHEFDLMDLGDKIHKGPGFYISGSNSRRNVNESIYLTTTQKDYDIQFFKKLIKIKPAYRIYDFLDYHLNYFLNNNDEKEDLFLNHIQYEILPEVKRAKRQEYSELTINWINNKKMDLQKQLKERDGFLKKAYEEAFNYDNSSPLLVSINPTELGRTLGLLPNDIERIVSELINEELVECTLGLQDLFITQKGLNYLRKLEQTNKVDPSMNLKVGNNSIVQIQQGTINSKQNIMKQSEKLDLILRKLYEYKDDGYYHSMVGICSELNIPLATEEWNRLAHRLEDNGYVRTMFKHNDCALALTTNGIDYCEQDSYTYEGSAIIENNYNISIVNSPGSNIVSQSQNVSIEQNFDEALQILDKIKDIIRNDSSIDKKKIEEINECLSEIREGIKNKQKPKFAIKSLIAIAGGIASVANYLTKLGELFGIVP